MSAALDQLAEELAVAAFEKLTPKVKAFFAGLAADKYDPLLTVSEASRRLKFSERIVRRLIADGHLKTAPGLTEIRIRQSTLDQYGK